jgi:hypothetical protein
MSRRVIETAIGLPSFAGRLFQREAGAQDSAIILLPMDGAIAQDQPVAPKQRPRLNLVALQARIDWRQTLHTNACCSRKWAGESIEKRRASGRESIKICNAANASGLFW